MRNNKGFGKIEIMTVIVMLLVVFAFLFYLILNGTGNQKFETMKENGLSFSKTDNIWLIEFIMNKSFSF